tara:strand:+ start:352 stop:2253 length:1902 start_codon:yes stop_codon:yes gene_type:complete
MKFNSSYPKLLKSNNILKKDIKLKIILTLFSTCVSASGFDTLSYHQKFIVAADNYRNGRYNLSEIQFSNILSKHRSYRDPAAQLMMAKAQYQSKNHEKAIETLKSIYSNYPSSPYQVDALILSGDIALERGKSTLAFKYYIRARTEIENVIYLNDIDERIYHAISMGLDENTVESLLFGERNSFNREIINLAKAYKAYTNGDSYELDNVMDQINTFELPGYFSGLYGKLKKISEDNFKKPVTIAVMLPLTGVNKDKGHAYLLGLSDYFELNADSTSIRLILYDTKSSALEIFSIYNRLKSDPSVVAVLGPITDEAILSVAALDPTMPVLVPKSEHSGLFNVAKNLFFLAPTSEIIARRTAQLMIQELNLKNIAVLSPGEGQQKLTTDFFIDECFQLGIDPVAIEWYIGKPENLSRQLKNIRRAAWDLVQNDTRNKQMDLEIDSLDALFDVDVADFFELPPEEEDLMDQKDSAKVVLETLEAIYVPLRSEDLTYIGTQLPIYNFKTIIFGNENWLNMPMLNQEVIGPHVEGMYIVSDVNSAISNASMDSFANYYTLAFDNLFLIQKIKNAGTFNRKNFIERLKKMEYYRGEYTFLKFSGKNKNVNGSAQVLRYLNKKLKNVGVYDGNNLTTVNE